MSRIHLLLCTAAGALASGGLPPHAAAAPVVQVPPAVPGPVAPGIAYADLVDLALDAPLVIDAAIRSAVAIRGAEAADVPPGRARFYVEADVQALVRGAGGLPARIGYLVDVPTDARGRPPRLKKLRVLLFARPVAGRPDQVQLVTRDAQRPWTPELDGRVRAVVREVLAPAAPPAITGVGNAFHVPGTLPGEGETQIFLQTVSGDPVSLLVLRRPGQDTRWAVSLGDIVDEAAGPPQRDTLAWYRLACGLPRTLPARSLDTQEPEAARIAREDYQFVLRQLGPCRPAAPTF